MPIVPRFKENQRLAGSNPTGYQSAGKSRIIGTAITKAANAGGKLVLLKLKQDKMRKSAQAKVGVGQVKILAEQAMQEVSADIARNSSDGVDDTKTFDEASAERKALILEKAGEKYGGRYSEAFSDAFDKVSVKHRGTTITNSTKKFQESFKASLDSIVSESTGLALTNPENIDNIVDNATGTFHEAMDALEIPDQNRENELGQIAKGLVDTAVRGHTEKGNYLAARELIVGSVDKKGKFQPGKYGKLYSAEEQAKKVKEINSEEMDVQDRVWKISDRREKMAEKRVDKLQKRELKIIRGALLAAEGNPLLMAKQVRKAKELWARMGITNAEYSNFLTRSDKGFANINRLSSYRISKHVYTGGSITDAESMVNKEWHSSNMLTATAEKWTKTLDMLKKQRASDPIRSKHFAALRAKLKEFTADTDIMMATIDRQDPDKVANKVARQQGAFAYLLEMEANGMDHGQAWVELKDKYFPGVSGISKWPGQPTPITDRETWHANKKWGEVEFRTSPKRREWRSYMMEAANTVKVEEAVDEDYSKMREKDATKITNGGGELFPDDGESDRLGRPKEFDDTMILSEEENDIPYFIRRRE